MKAILQVGDKSYAADLDKPMDISIEFQNEKGPRAFYAPPYESEPFASQNFIGSLNEGSPVNFYNLKINPHGNGTHTESVLHIDKRGKSISNTLYKSHFIAKLISVKPHSLSDSEDKILKAESLEGIDLNNIEALVVRTLPNYSIKKNTDYSGTNPTYVCSEFIKELNKKGIKHLLIDLPSVDREEDGGALESHKAFWKVNNAIELNKTITEMIFVDNNIEDGLYLLNLQTISVDIDASPSKPILYQLKEE